MPKNVFEPAGSFVFLHQIFKFKGFPVINVKIQIFAKAIEVENYQKLHIERC